MGTAV
jgi:hypothetical protein